MAEKSWTFELEERAPSGQAADSYFSPRRATHTLDLHHNYWITKRAIRLDGVLLPPDQIRSYSIFGMQSDDLFNVDGHACVVHIRSNGVAYNYDFVIDGISVQTEEAVDIPRQVFQAQPGGKDAMPGWAWLFIMLCLVVGIGAIFAGLWLASLLTKTRPSSNARFVHLLVGPIILQALLAIVAASKEPRKDARSRMLGCAIILGRTGLIVITLVFLAFTLIH